MYHLYNLCYNLQTQEDYGFNITGFPRNKVNPFAQFKTRGNGATSFKLELKSDKEGWMKYRKIVLENIKQLSVLQDKSNPGVVFYDGEITPELQELDWKQLEILRN